MLQELIPPSERVRILLNDSRYADLNLEERGQAIAKKKYGRFFKIIFWKVMGISRADLFHWAVLKLVHEYRRDHPEQFQENAETNNNNNNGANEAANEEGDVTVEATTGEASNEGESNQEEITTTTSPPPTTEVDISESATRRQIIENRV
ncbi:hypothetical protein Cantr_06838 [Candida viswanathii]|uniref:Uncharacterized protein n=1 Tax=Candida viswanathii TaxID=5486 RepID=A0A367XZH5_9ASCO|nr:hypothetical protein Cantr_06838 [Candida viswanathii]